MNLSLESAALFGMHLSVLVIPGVNFATIVRNTVMNGLRSGVWTALGISGAILFHVFLSIFSLSVILNQAPQLFAFIKYAGICYLLYLGSRFIISAFGTEQSKSKSDFLKSTNGNDWMSPFGSFKAGFLIDLLNPFVSIFFLTCFSTMVHESTPLSVKCGYALGIFLMTWTWFSLVSLFFASAMIRDQLFKKSRWVECFSGVSMYYFAIRVFLS